ncbi:ATP-dependent nuclease [Aquimarina aggregata]|uniref:ATP-dependent nuclease n=1 Tax=Aquimarina aggregata TaxID=1642818 RepID=UPI0024929065|nr:AAA family ATPase [Aquimarina aggregata]
MKLIKLEIEDYKSIKNIEWTLNQNITCLVGQNESGKSNLIDILDLLVPTKFDTLTYDTFTNRSSERFLNAQIPYIKAIFEVSNKTRKLLIDKLAPYNQQKNQLARIKDATHFVMQTEVTANNNYNYYFENETDVFEFPYLIPNVSHYPAALKIINEFQTKIVRLDGDYVDQFELTVQQVTSNSMPNSGLIKLMKLAGVKDFAKINPEPRILSKYLSQLNKRLDSNFTKKYYSQDRSVQLKIVHNSGKLFLEIEDDTKAEYAIHERSDGFKYFFGLLIEAASISNSKSDVIFVLDEPGSKLHPSGQKDLLKYLEELSENFRVIYTTHSPFLINRLFPNRVRILERHSGKGTIFKNKGFSKNWHPMRSALGLSISDSFYYSEKALIVEGPEDIIFLGSLINMFNVNKEIDINTDIFSFIDSGGEGNLPSMVQIMIEENRPIMVLMDSDSQKTYNKIEKKSKSLKSGLLVLNQVSDFKESAISIEDLLPKELLRSSVNGYIKELIEDESLNLIKDKSAELTNIDMDNSIYKDSIAPFIKDNFTNPSKMEEEWSKEKVPISKVGIARKFDQTINHSSFDYERYKGEFKFSLKLVKTVILKLKLKG